MRRAASPISSYSLSALEGELSRQEESGKRVRLGRETPPERLAGGRRVARFELDAWRGKIDQLAAEIRRIELDLERSVVKAPFSGIVAAELTEVGQWVGKGTTVMIFNVRTDVRFADNVFKIPYYQVHRNAGNDR